MSAPLLTTKLYMPAPSERAVPRPRLIERLNEGLARARAFVLVSAPAGFGKSTLLAEWIDLRRRRDPGLGAAWLSLDEGDGDPSRFLLYLAAALRGADPSCGIDAMAALQSPRPPSAEAILIDLINEIDGTAKDFVLVLDDYHAVDSPKVDELLSFLVERFPARLRLVIATREDPNLPLARLRARGELCELRAADLRFTSEEAADFLGRAMGLELKAEEIAALDSRTEGWIAGLQLAALSMRGQQDIAGFIRSFTGSHRFVLDYLAEEVLLRESEDIQAFLLRTSVLDRLCGPLCDALMEGGPAVAASGQETLEYLERANIFIVPLDGERKWYRYHRLFAEILRQRLEQGGKAGIAELQVKASRWYEENGNIIEAFRQAAAAGDIDRAERLIKDREMPLHFRDAVVAILDWLEFLPTSVFESRPSLRILFATTSLVAGRTVGVEEALASAESALWDRDGEPEAEPTAEARDLLGRIAAARATLAVTRYQSEEILRQARLALEYLSPEDLPFRMTAAWAVAVAHFLQEDRAALGKDFAELDSASRGVGDVFFMQLAQCGMGETEELGNRLYAAAETYKGAIALFGEHPQPNAGDAHLGLARIKYEWNELDAAEEEAERGLHLARQYDGAIDRFILCELELARVKLARGLVPAAAAKLDELAAAARARGFLHRLPEIAELRVLAFLRLGEVEAAAGLASSFEIPRSRARVALARKDAAAALALIEPLLGEMKANCRRDENLKALTLLALALGAGDREEEALGALGEAMEEAEGGGFVRLFLDEGEPMAALLAAAAALGVKGAYAGKLLAAFDAERKMRDAERVESAVLRGQFFVDPLSRRELEVLRLLAEGLSNQEIGERLFLALDTIKGHNRRIFDKLEVKRRTEAIARARDLGLL